VATAEGNAVAVRGVRISLDHRLYYKICKEALDDIMESDFPSEIRKADFGKSEDLPAESRKPYFGASDKRISRKPTNEVGEIGQSDLGINQRVLSKTTAEKTTKSGASSQASSSGNDGSTLSLSFLLWLVKMRKLGTLWTKSARSLGHSVVGYRPARLKSTYHRAAWVTS